MMEIESIVEKIQGLADSLIKENWKNICFQIGK